MRIIEEEQLDFDDVSIMPKRSNINSRSEVDIWRTFKWKDGNDKIHELMCKPIISAIMTTVGTPKMAYELVNRGYLASIEKHYKSDEICDLYQKLENKALFENKDKTYYTDKISLAIGLNDSVDTLIKVSQRHKINIIHVDCPNAYIPNFKKRVKEIRELFPEVFLIAGVVVTSDLTTDLINMGVNCVSMAICSGSACKTTERTAVRRPLLSMIVDCADAAHQQNAYVLISGGCRNAQDICIALGGGCDIIMTGSLFAGTNEADGDIIEKRYITQELDENNNQRVIIKRFKKYFGMASKYAMQLYNSGGDYKTDEGRMKLIPYTGSLDDILSQIEGGIKSMMTFIGAENLKSIPKKTTFYKVKHGVNDKFLHCEDF
jgi:GMP reductase